MKKKTGIKKEKAVRAAFAAVFVLLAVLCVFAGAGAGAGEKTYVAYHVTTGDGALRSADAGVWYLLDANMNQTSTPAHVLKVNGTDNDYYFSNVIAETQGLYQKGTKIVNVEFPKIIANATVVNEGSGYSYDLAGSFVPLADGYKINVILESPEDATIKWLLVDDAEHVTTDLGTVSSIDVMTAFTHYGDYVLQPCFDNYLVPTANEFFNYGDPIGFTLVKADYGEITLSTGHANVGEELTANVCGIPGEQYKITTTAGAEFSDIDVDSISSDKKTVTFTMPAAGVFSPKVKALAQCDDVTISLYKVTGDIVLADETFEILGGFITAHPSHDSYTIGDDIVITGIAEGQPDNVMYYIFNSPGLLRTGLVPVDSNGRFELNLPAPEMGNGWSVGQYYVVIQHPMYDHMFNVGPVASSSGGYDIKKNPVGSYDDQSASLIFNTLGRQGANLAVDLCYVLDSQDFDDMYAKTSFLVSQPTPVSLSVVVMDTENNYISGADVVVSSDKMAPMTLKTTTDGSATFTLYPGVYTVSVTKTGYIGQMKSISLGSTGNTQVIQLIDNSSILMTVIEEDGTPIEGAEIRINNVSEGFTDEFGHLNVHMIRGADNVILVTANSYNDYLVGCHLGFEITAFEPIVLHPVTPTPPTTGELIIRCNVEGANVTVYDANWNLVANGVVSGGQADIYVDTAKGAAYATISASGYAPKVIGVSVVAGNPTVFTVNLTEAPQIIGGSFGFLQVLTNVIGANVKLLDISGNECGSGVTDNTGAATIKIMLVGTPVKSVVVSANGYTTKQMEIGTIPGPGETIQMIIRLESLSNFTLSPGWNFISVPKKLAAENDTAGELFAGVNTGRKSPLSYNAETKGWDTVTTSTVISPLNAYWIYSTETKVLTPTFEIPTIETAPPVPSVKTVYTGWNAVGASAENPVTAKAAFTGVNWRSYTLWNGETQTYGTIYIKDGTGQYSDEQYIPLYKGGWLYMDGNGTINGYA